MFEQACGIHKFSVVIPLYNKNSHIVSTLNSVLAQSFNDFEIIVIDDGSTDDSLSQAQTVHDPRVKIIPQRNQGVSSARNRGVKESSGDYIAFLDADDHWFPWHLEELSNLIDNYPGHGIYSVAHEIFREGKIYLPAQSCAPNFKGVVRDFFGSFSKSLALVNSTTACLPRDSMLNTGGFPEGIRKGEDVYVWLKAAIDGGLVYSVRVCAQYNQDGQCRSNLSLSEEIPYYLAWLDDLISSGSLDKTYVEGANKFLKAGVFYNAAGFRLEGNKTAFENMRKLKVSSCFTLRALLIVLQFSPKNVLKIAQRFRHAQA